MAIVVMEGLEVEAAEEAAASKRIVRLGPLNVPCDLRDEIEALAEEEHRSISNMCVVLIQAGLMAKAARGKTGVRACVQSVSTRR